MKRKNTQKKQRWKEVETHISQFDKEALMDLIHDLYLVSPENKDFFHARFCHGDEVLSGYKRIIRESINPESEESDILDFAKATQAIDRYCKAANNLTGEADLRIFFVECGHEFTLKYGDIGEDFYDALLEMYEHAIQTVLDLPTKEQDIFRARLKKIMDSSSGIGWGYHDGLCDAYCEAFQECL